MPHPWGDATKYRNNLGVVEIATDEILNLLLKSIDEVKDSTRRLHERMDELYRSGIVTKTDCEGYRRECPGRNKVPYSVVVLAALLSAIISGVVVKLF